MQVFQNFPHLSKKSVVALGMFDGLHLGHQKIIRQAVELAQQKNFLSVVCSFQNHPFSVLCPENIPLQIQNNFLTQKLLEKFSVDIFLTLPFTKELANQSPEDFIKMLCEYLQPQAVIVGENYSFGKGGKGSPQDLKHLSFQTIVCPMVIDAPTQKIISSTSLRQKILEGDLETVNRFLGRPFAKFGKVCHGDQRGRTLNFPTANVNLSKSEANLPNGVYAVEVFLNREHFFGMANIGSNPTFYETLPVRLEVHLFDFDRDIYGKNIEIQFHKKIRSEKKFSSLENLKAQLYFDKELIQNFFAQQKRP